MWAQNETQHINGMEEVVLDVYLMNGQKFTFKVSPTLQTNDLLEVSRLGLFHLKLYKPNRFCTTENFFHLCIADFVNFFYFFIFNFAESVSSHSSS